MCWRKNITQEFLGEIFQVSQPTVSRTIGRLTPLLAWLLRVYVLDPDLYDKIAALEARVGELSRQA